MAKKSKKKVTKKVTTNKSTEVSDKSSSKEVKTQPKEKVERKPIYNNLAFKIGISAVLILFVMFFAFYVRSGPINLNGLDKQVEANVYAQIKNIISQQIDIQYPNLNPTYKEEKLNEEYQKVLDTGVYELNGQKIVVSDIAKQNAVTVKQAFKADNNQTYLNAIDPYHFLGITTNYVKNGHTGTSLKNVNGEEVPWIDYKLAPNGVAGSYHPDFHVWLESKLFKLNNIDQNSGIGEKTAVVFLIPVFFAMFSIIPIYLILRKYSNDIFALFGSILLTSIGTYVSRTVAGFVDTDAYNVFFPLLIVVFLIYSFTTKNKVLGVIYAIIAGFSQGIFLWAWSSGWFIFLFALIALLGYFSYIVLVNLITKNPKSEFSKKVLNDITTLITYTISAFVFTYMFANMNIFTSTYDNITKSITGIATISQTNIWPNVLSSVAELNPASFTDIVGSVGGKIVFFIAMLGLVLLSLDFKSENDKFVLYKRALVILSIIWFGLFAGTSVFLSLTANMSLIFLVLLFLPVGIGLILSLISKNTDNKVFLAILLSIWMAGTIYMSLNGVRFILLLAPAFAISFGLGLFYIAKIINNFFVEEFEIKNDIAKLAFGFGAVTILFLILFIPMAKQANAISQGTTPNFDDAWYGTMYKIRDNSNTTAIITSWWDFGHFFAAVSQRGVTFDGATQTTPQAHWVGKLLLEDEEEVSHDILQMLVCGGNNAFDHMLSYTNGTNADAVKINKIIYSTFGEDNNETRQILGNNKYYTFTNEQIDDIMANLACESPREDFLITSEDMVGKAAVWAHWGSWDFTKKYVYENYKTKTVQEIAQNIDENETLISKYVEELKAIDVKAETQDIKRETLLNQWFAPYPSYIPQQLSCVLESNTSVNCQNGLVKINGNMGNFVLDKNFESSLRTNIGFTGVRKVIYPSSQTDLKVLTINDSGNYDFMYLPGNGQYNLMLVQSPLGDSLFSKLFYFDGMGTKYFDKFDDVNSVTGVQVKTWKVKWNLEEVGDMGLEIGDNSTTLNVSSVDFNVSDVEVGDLVDNSS